MKVEEENKNILTSKKAPVSRDNITFITVQYTPNMTFIYFVPVSLV